MRILHYTLVMENPTDNAATDGDAAEDNSGDATIKELMARAKRAHELVDAVDLKKLARHDREETAKLATVTTALHELSQGHDVGHVEGVDEVHAEEDPEHAHRTEIAMVIDEAGWSDDIGRLLHRVGDEVAHRPLDLIPHKEGLPSFDVCLAPAVVTGDGNYGIFVSSKGIFAAAINDPAGKHHWRIIRSTSYDNPQELRGSLDSFRQTAFE